MTIEEFLKDWNKQEETLIDFICDCLRDSDVEYYEIERNCAWFIEDNNTYNVYKSDILILISKIKEGK